MSTEKEAETINPSQREGQSSEYCFIRRR